MDKLATKFDRTPVDLPVPDHVPKDRVLDLRFAVGQVKNDLMDPYAPVAPVLGPDVPRILYYPYQMMGMTGGCWVVSHYDDVREVYENDELFSNVGVAQFQALVGETWPSIPLGVDKPLHAKYRGFLNQFFFPKELNKLEPQVRAIITEMIDAVAKDGEVDLTYEIGRVYPVKIFFSLMGYPMTMFEKFLHWENEILHTEDLDRMKTAITEVLAYIRSFVEEERKNPKEGTVTNAIVFGGIDDRNFTDDEIMGMMFFLWLGGLDTVASTIGQMFRRLALDPELQDKLRNHPEMHNSAVEEFLRTQPLVYSRRTLKKDHTWHGVTMKKGDRVMCLVSAANFDPDKFECPHQFDPERSNNRHLTLISGPHICLGAHLARRELRILLQEWFKRIPPFKAKEGADLSVTPGLISIPHLPLVWDKSLVKDVSDAD